MPEQQLLNAIARAYEDWEFPAAVATDDTSEDWEEYSSYCSDVLLDAIEEAYG